MLLFSHTDVLKHIKLGIWSSRTWNIQMQGKKHFCHNGCASGAQQPVVSQRRDEHGEIDRRRPIVRYYRGCLLWGSSSRFKSKWPSIWQCFSWKADLNYEQRHESAPLRIRLLQEANDKPSCLGLSVLLIDEQHGQSVIELIQISAALLSSKIEFM